MEELEDEAILLRTDNLQETDRIVSFLSRHHGTRRGVAKASRRKYSRFAGKLQPCTRVRIRWFERSNRDLVRIRDVEILQPFRRAEDDLEAILFSQVFAETVSTLVQENEPTGEKYFRLLSACLEALDEGQAVGIVARYFELWALRFAGVFADFSDCPACGSHYERGAVLPAHEEVVLCTDCTPEDHGYSIDNATVRWIQRTRREPLHALGGEVSAQTLRSVEGLAGRLRRNFLGFELRSYGVLRKLISG